MALFKKSAGLWQRNCEIRIRLFVLCLFQRFLAHGCLFVQVVFKALIVVHTLVRAGSQEAVLGYLSGTKMLGLDSIISGQSLFILGGMGLTSKCRPRYGSES